MLGFFRKRLVALEAAGASFVRLNPDSAYLEALGAEPTPDAEANLVWNYDTMLQALVAEETDKWIFSAAVREMADRAHAGQTDPDLDGVLWP